MRKGLASSTAFYVLGMIFGLFTILYFGIEVILEISPAVKSAILFLASITFFSGTGLTDSKWGNIPLYFLASTSYLIFVGYTLLRFDFGSAATFLILAGSSTVFLAAGYLVGEKEIRIPEKKAKYLVAAGLILIVGLFLFDLSGSQPEVSLQLRDSVNLTQGEETAVGTVTVSNSFVLPRAFEVPNYRACTQNSRVDIYTEKEGDTVPGKQKVDINLKARYYVPETENLTGKVYQVRETGECIEKEGQISVFKSYSLD